jgi:hypothetical protein
MSVADLKPQELFQFEPDELVDWAQAAPTAVRDNAPITMDVARGLLNFRPPT